MNSPFDSLFKNETDIPAAFRVQFLTGADDGLEVVLEGRMNVWHQPRWLFPFLWMAEKMGALLSEQGQDIPATLVMHTLRDKKGMPVQYWDRTFQFSRERYFNTVLKYLPEIDDVAEYVGPGKLIPAAWNAEYHAPDTLEFHSELAPVRVAGRAFWLPKPLRRLLFGVIHFKQTVASHDSNQTHIEMVMNHPLLGDMFGYNGTFVVSQRAIESRKHT